MTMVHHCGPGPCKDCRLKDAENKVQRLTEQLKATQAELAEAKAAARRL